MISGREVAAELLVSIRELEQKLLRSRSVASDIREGFDHLRKVIRDELTSDDQQGSNDYIDENLLAGLEQLVEDTPDVELRETLRAAFSKIRRQKLEKSEPFAPDELPAETARRLKLAV